MHSKVAKASSALNQKLADELALGFDGLAVIDAVGAELSTVHPKVAATLVLPAASTAFTENVWLPSARPLYPFGLVQPAYAPPSIAHWNVADASSEANEKLADELALGSAGLAVIDAVGAFVSTVHVKLAGFPTLPTVSVARTENVWLPSASPLYP